MQGFLRGQGGGAFKSIKIVESSMKLENKLVLQKKPSTPFRPQNAFSRCLRPQNTQGGNQKGRGGGLEGGGSRGEPGEGQGVADSGKGGVVTQRVLWGVIRT